MTQLSPHFTLEEMIASDTAARHGWANFPDAQALANLERLAKFLEAIRTIVGQPLQNKKL
jgi:hypothetical protein